jgi:hypothetical protein
MAWFTYEIDAIDFGWEGLPTVKEAAGRIGKWEGESLEAEGNGLAPGLYDFRRAWRSALDAASAAGCSTNSEDWRQEPVVFWMPKESAFDFGFVIKQDNNGTTYVISPVPLPHLGAPVL